MQIKSFLLENKLTIAYFVVLSVLPTFCSSFIIYYFVKYESTIREFNLFTKIMFFVIATQAMAFALTPSTFISLISGFFWGWGSVPFVVISYLVASLIGFIAAKLIDRGSLMNTLNKYEKIHSVLLQLRKRQMGLVVLARLSPILPFALMNVVLSVLKYNIFVYLFSSLIGMLPRTLLAIFVGTQMSKIIDLFNKGNDPLISILLMVLTLLAITGMVFYIRNAIKKSKIESVITNMGV